MHCASPALLALLCLALTGCNTLGYYGHLVAGQWQLLRGRQPVEALIEAPGTDAALRDKLVTARAAREFASRELALPDNGSYTSYVDLERPHAVWLVIATDEFSVEPRRWCYPVLGCFSYRGFFDERRARACAERLHGQGHDVYLNGATAYSTLGWFDDPLLNTMVARDEVFLVDLLFHELAHQRLHIRNDTAFNEAFAVTVARAGVRRWLQGRGRGDALGRYLRHQARERELHRLLAATRSRLSALYAQDMAPHRLRAAKRRLFERLRENFAALRAGWGGYSGFDAWMEQDLNNAHLALVATYHELEPAFEALLARHGGDLAAFYAAAEAIGRLPAEERRARLRALLTRQ
jgi:predicted aminopeptidase